MAVSEVILAGRIVSFFFFSDVEFAKPICNSLIGERQSPQTTVKSGQKAISVIENNTSNSIT